MSSTLSLEQAVVNNSKLVNIVLFIKKPMFCRYNQRKNEHNRNIYTMLMSSR
ncbi:hypothetical protein GCM10007978_13360 [Shewanella hanedai]|nr:hypothetical protein GCM10007978_13360 [Shewanella hanedai]